MQWEAGEQAGFTAGIPWIDVNENCEEINVRESLADPDSVFFYYQKLIGLRKRHSVISEGSYEPVPLKQEGIFAYRRSRQEEKLLVFANFTGKHQEIEGRENLDNWEVLLSNCGSLEINGKKNFNWIHMAQSCCIPVRRLKIPANAAPGF